MSDAVFYEMLSSIDSFSYEQKKALSKALKKSLSFRLPFTRQKQDLHLTESLVGAAGNEDISIEQIKAERLL